MSTGAMGTVSAWDDAEGWGVLASSLTPGGCFASFATVRMDGFRRLSVGQLVTFDFLERAEGGYSYQATEVRVVGGSTVDKVVDAVEDSSAFRSVLEIHGEVRPSPDY